MSEIIASSSLVDHAAFDRIIMSTLPEVAAELDSEDRAALHIEMGAVARATSRAIETGDGIMEAQHFALIDDVLARAAPDVENAIFVSYLENLFLWDKRPAFLSARTRLPSRLAVALQELEAHWDALPSGGL